MRDNDVLMHYGVKGMKWRQRKSKSKLQEGSDKTGATVNLVDRRMQQVRREAEARAARQQLIMNEAKKRVNEAKEAMTGSKQKLVDPDVKKKREINKKNRETVQKAVKANQIKREWDKATDKMVPSRAKRKPKVSLK